MHPDIIKERRSSDGVGPPARRLPPIGKSRTLAPPGGPRDSTTNDTYDGLGDAETAM